MKKTGSVALLITLIFSTCIPSFAQKRIVTRKAAPAPAPAAKVDSILFDSVDAVSEGGGVVLRWGTKSETRIVGFYVYRVTAYLDGPTWRKIYKQAFTKHRADPGILRIRRIG